MSNVNQELVSVFDSSPWPVFETDQIDAVKQVLESGKVNYWTGNIGREYEQEYAAYTERKHAIALHNGTLALELALYAFDIGEGDEVITSPRTFIASASAAVMSGAKPIFADVDLDSQNITAATIEKVVTPRTKAIIPVHLGGWPCAMDEIMTLAEKHDLIVIEDCAQAHGAKYDGKPVGSFGHAAAFSFCQDKIITTGGEGGMLVMDDEDAWFKAWAYKDHGKSFDAVYNKEHPPGFRWVHNTFGTNWRMLEIQAAIGRIQLKKLDNWVAIRQRNAGILRDTLNKLPALRIPWPGDAVEHAFYRFYAFVQPEFLRPGWSRDKLMAKIQDAGIPCTIGSCPEIYLEEAFQDAGLQLANRLPNARELGETSLAFLVHPTLSEEAMQKTADAIFTILQKATKSG